MYNCKILLVLMPKHSKIWRVELTSRSGTTGILGVENNKRTNDKKNLEFWMYTTHDFDRKTGPYP